jgi:hypothetical protein
MAGYILEQCPHCSFPVGTNLGVHSELGPDVRECRRCGEVFGTGRSEWPDKRALGKMWYVGLSLAYALVAGLLGAICVRGAVHVWQNPGQSEMPLDGPGLVPGLVLGVANGSRRPDLSRPRFAQASRRKRTRSVPPSFLQPAGKLVAQMPGVSDAHPAAELDSSLNNPFLDVANHYSGPRSHGPVIANVTPGVWMLTNSHSPSKL